MCYANCEHTNRGVLSRCEEHRNEMDLRSNSKLYDANTHTHTVYDRNKAEINILDNATQNTCMHAMPR